MDAQLRNYDRRLERTYQKAIDNLSKENFSLLEKYDNEMATLGLMKSTRAKQLSIIVDISIRFGKDWKEITKEDIDRLIRSVIDEFGEKKAVDLLLTKANSNYEIVVDSHGNSNWTYICRCNVYYALAIV